MKIQDSVVIVTGASGGIGLAVAKALANKGAKVALKTS
jgi:NAD(P)-dependent dehydrogenase (short-subunit alcohol dehydrogenase family)